MLSVVGGLAVMLGSSPLAAQTAASAIRSAPSTVAPSETFTVDDYRFQLWHCRHPHGYAASRVRIRRECWRRYKPMISRSRSLQDVNFAGGEVTRNVHLHCQGS